MGESKRGPLEIRGPTDTPPTVGPKHVCFRHPEWAARRRCYRCRRWLCPPCQHRRAHHIFCGVSCFRRWQVEDWGRRVYAWVRRHAVGTWLFVLAIGAALGLAIFWDRPQTSPTPQTMPLSPNPVSRTHDDARPEVIHIVRPVYGARLSAPQVTVEGRGPAEQTLALWLNGEVIGTTRSDAEGVFTFPDVPLAADDNLLQVQVQGSALFSPAIVVYRVTDSRVVGLHYAQRAPDNLLRGNPTRPEVALTFDGSFSDGDVGELLRHVEALHIPVTVFLTGEFIAQFPAAARRLAESPWVEVGNHTLNHRHWTSYEQDRRQATLPDVTPRTLEFELIETARRFRAATGRTMVPLWRAPYGEHNAELRRWAARLGYTHVGWTVEADWSLDTMDWVDDPRHPMYRPAQAIVRAILERAARPPDGINGGIILMHLGSRRPVGERMVDVLPELVAGLRRQGYTPVPVSTLLRHLRPQAPGPEPAQTAAGRR